MNSEEMARNTQEAMDGSPAVVEIFLSRKFETTNPEAHQGIPAGPYARIKFQCGPIGEVGVNGCAIEDVIDVLVARLEGFQRGRFACTENRSALLHLKSAKGWLVARTAARQSQGVEGSNAPHVSEEDPL